MRVRARLVDIEPATQIDAEGTEHFVTDSAGIRTIFSDQTDQTSSATISDGRPASPGMELDLRGQRADDAVDTLERYLERAYLSGLPYVRIIHGKGTGRLRNVVRTELKSVPFVKSFESGEQKEGGEGVTVVLFTPED
jgi:DNA mismatch repair protein MutS2